VTTKGLQTLEKTWAYENMLRPPVTTAPDFSALVAHLWQFVLLIQLHLVLLANIVHTQFVDKGFEGPVLLHRLHDVTVDDAVHSHTGLPLLVCGRAGTDRRQGRHRCKIAGSGT
jgi:hypothetical protein